MKVVPILGVAPPRGNRTPTCPHVLGFEVQSQPHPESRRALDTEALIRYILQLGQTQAPIRYIIGTLRGLQAKLTKFKARRHCTEAEGRRVT